MKIVTLFHKLHTLKHFSTAPKWNTSTINLTITNPLLISMENCSSMSQLKQIQAQMTRNCLIFHVFPVSRIISFCALSDHRDINYAFRVFNYVSNSNVYIWNTMIRGFCVNNDPLMGVLFFKEMVRGNVEMDERSFVYVIKGYGMVSGFREARGIHCRIVKVGFECSVLVQNGLIHFYGDGGLLGCARQVFDECTMKDVVSWTAMIDRYVKGGDVNEGLRVFGLMVCSEVEFNEVTMIAVFSGCALKGDLGLGRRMHGFVEKCGVECGLKLRNAMLDMYVKCGCLMSAKRVFEGMECRDVFSWTSMVNGYARYGKLEIARKYFDEMPVKNVVSWNAMIAGYSQNNRPKDAIDLFQDMVKGGIIPIEATLVPVLSACAQSGCLDMGRWVHHHYVHEKKIELGASLGNTLIDMYAKCGEIGIAEELFNEMPKRDLVSWNTMIVGYADHGDANKALNLFKRMKNQGIKPDDITFIGILSACSHAGLVAKGREYFSGMQQNFGLEPKAEHYACMIDLLGRIGSLGQAYDMIRKMPMKPDEAAWGALLNACRMHGNADLGKIAADNLISLVPEDSGTYVLLANLCAKERKWGKVRIVRSMMRDKGIRKTPGHSFIEVEGNYHEFSAANDSHPRSKDIYKILEDIFVLSNLGDEVASPFQLIDYFEKEDIQFFDG